MNVVDTDPGSSETDCCANIALASAANLCCVEVVSRTAQQNETWSIIIKVKLNFDILSAPKPIIFRRVPTIFSGIQSALLWARVTMAPRTAWDYGLYPRRFFQRKLEAQSAIVTAMIQLKIVSNILKVPVRRSSHSSPQQTVDLIVKDLQTFALVCPRVSFALDLLGRQRNGEDARSRVLTLPKVVSSFL